MFGSHYGVVDELALVLSVFDCEALQVLPQ
ncbi:MAG: hypothetical protein S4CHLAM102_05310 [Chlamydiia bacterium]|nr:hypothetical protein [Chlamydiia bacterium]